MEGRAKRYVAPVGPTGRFCEANAREKIWQQFPVQFCSDRCLHTRLFFCQETNTAAAKFTHSNARQNGHRWIVDRLRHREVKRRSLTARLPAGTLLHSLLGRRTSANIKRKEDLKRHQGGRRPTAKQRRPTVRRRNWETWFQRHYLKHARNGQRDT